MTKEEITEALLADWLKAKVSLAYEHSGNTTEVIGSLVRRGMKVAMELGVRLNVDPDVVDMLKVHMDDEVFAHRNRAITHAEYGGYTTSEVTNLITGDPLTYASNGFVHFQLREVPGTPPGADPWYSWYSVELHPVIVPPLPAPEDLFS